jgi:hypothetical protein
MACLLSSHSARVLLAWQTNHTNFFMCVRLKMHPVRHFADTINAQLYPGHAGVHVLEPTTLKFFPRNNFDSIKVLAVKPVTDAKLHGEHQYINPYFWSHLTLIHTATSPA